jgi:mannose-6-phosphate isomerase
MPATLLATKRVEKPWGRHHLYPGFPDPPAGSQPIGEVWFQSPHPDEDEMLIKYLFTSEKLSVQDHPSDEEAHKRGLPRGKDECWTILTADPDSTIALGPKQVMTKDELRAAAENTTLEDKLDWRPVKVGDFLYCPSGTIHAIGGGITCIEVQQNSDTTYRLYDYGSSRELHLKDGVEVAHLTPYQPITSPGQVADDRRIMVEGPKFVLERWPGGEHQVSLPAGKKGWLVPIRGHGVVGGVAWKAGECVMVDGPELVHASADADLLFVYTGTQRM